MAVLPTLAALRCFDASARLGSFTRAAIEVHLTQGAVSHQILGLEEQLGLPLFVRRRSGLQLTAAGQAYWNEVAAALRQIERATQNLITHKGRGGTLNLCVASSFASYWLMPRLAGFVAAHPEVTLNLSTHVGPVDFERSPHDAAIEYCDGATSQLQASKVLALELRPYASPSLLQSSGTRATGLPRRPRLVALLNELPLIRHTTVAHAWPRWLSCAGLADDVQPRRVEAGPQYDLLSMALNGAIAGIGVTLLPHYVAQAAVASGQLVLLSDVAWTSEKAYHLRYPAWKSGLAALQSFQRWLATAPG
jgi:LysR family glycine cleavage system transcriptional activator